jgi:DNA-binding MarR family transcriptional regulator
MATPTRTDAGVTLAADVEVLATADDLRALVGKLRRRLQEQASGEEFTPSQTAVLLRLHKHGSATLSELARAEGMRPQSMSAIVAALERAGLVVGAPHPTDGRQTVLSISDAALELIESNRAAKNDWLARSISSRYTDSECAELVRGIELLHRLLDA